MPTYQYVCTECSEPLEVVQRFSDDPLTECPTCEGRLRKQFSAVGVVFKGSGFYRTDSRAGAGAASGANTGNGSGPVTSEGKSDGASEPKGGSTKETTSDAKSGGASKVAGARDSSSNGSSQSSSKGPSRDRKPSGDSTKVA